MGKKKQVKCGQCPNERDMTIKDALCRACYRTRHREAKRMSRRIDPSNYLGPKPEPSKRCIDCRAADAVGQNRCRPCLNSYKGMHRRKCGQVSWAEYVTAKKAAAMTPEQRVEANRRTEARRAARLDRACTTPGCAGTIETTYGKRCEPCRFMSGDTKPTKRPLVRPVIDEKAVTIGAAAFPAPPVAVIIKGVRITRVPASMDAEWRERSAGRLAATGARV
jgi:hypothetical protein